MRAFIGLDVSLAKTAKFALSTAMAQYSGKGRLQVKPDRSSSD